MWQIFISFYPEDGNLCQTVYGQKWGQEDMKLLILDLFFPFQKSMKIQKTLQCDNLNSLIP